VLRYQQIEGGFTQPNGGVNRQMLGWACAQATDLGGDLLELYCGNGNFTVALAPRFGRVLATEVSKSSVQSAHYNLAANGIDNVAMVRMSSDEISGALARRREYQRMKDIDLDGYRFSTLFVDPPRSGLDAPTLELARGFDHILYISCNPQTLQDNVAALQATHRVIAAAAFDQFPYTDHLECGLLLARR
jgi:tRNA (uracil-5-)-methyltransferase